jgi:hypothetical protein
MPMDNILDLTVILNSYNRPKNINTQIEYLNKQTIKPKEIWVWCNQGSNGLPKITDSNIKIVTSNFNYKFHARFAFGLLVTTKYVAFFDDDCFPQNKWFENCYNSIQNKNGIYGGSGIILKNNQYMPHEKVGWNGTNHDTITEVDLVGHAWFMEKNALKYLFAEEPLTWDNGEDIQLSYLAQKYGNIKTYVPPHPKNDKSLWSNDYNLGRIHGDDINASYKNNKNHYEIRNNICSTYIKKGWKTVIKK